jgi:cyclophilin family peptidyl-prolyl cis-trans isomerase
MARPTSKRQRSDDASHQRRHRAHTAAERAQRRRKVVATVVVAGLLLSSGGAVVAVVLSSLGGGSSPAPTTSIPTPPTTSTADPVVLPLPAVGASADTDLPCPAPDGSSPRTTSFAGPPPLCLPTTPDGSIDTSVNLTAVVTTTAGDLTYLLSTQRAPQTVNSFVFLAGYGYFDDAPFDVITPLAWAEAGTNFIDAPYTAAAGPGWLVQRESPEQGMVSTPGMLAMATAPDGSSQPGRLLVALGDRAAALPVATTFFGVLLDGTSTLAAIQRSGREDGLPTAAVLIKQITIETGA